MREHESDSDIAVLKQRVTAIEAAIVSLIDIQVSLAEIKSKLVQIESLRPWQSSFDNHEYRLAESAKRITELEKWRDEAVRRIAAWGGGLAVLFMLVTIFAPNIRELLTKP